MNVSDAYIVAINEPFEQVTYFADFGFVQPGAREGMTLGHSGFGRWGNRLAQLNNRVYTMGGKWASLEMNRSVLGQGWEYIQNGTSRQVGEWSNALSSANGSFTIPPWLEMRLDMDYNTIGVHIFFDEPAQEWATRVRVSYFSSTNALIESREFDNDSYDCSLDFLGRNVRRIRIEILSWNLPRRFAKVCQVIPGQIWIFRDHNMYSFSLTESISPFSQVVVPETILTFPDEGQRFNIINPVGLSEFLREFMEMTSSLGLVTAAGIEHINTGDFFLFSWPTNLDAGSHTFIGRPDMGFAGRDYIPHDHESEEIVHTFTDTAQMAIRLAEQAAFKAPISINTGNFPLVDSSTNSITLVGAISQFAIAAGGYIKFERDGTYSLNPLIYPEPERTITYDNMWGKPSITQNTLLSGITIQYADTRPGHSGLVNEFYPMNPDEPNAPGQNITIQCRFIQSKAEADRVAMIALEFFGKRLAYSIPYRGDMSITPGMVVSVETDFGFQNVLILEHDTLFDNRRFLQSTRLRGVGI